MLKRTWITGRILALLLITAVAASCADDSATDATNGDGDGTDASTLSGRVTNSLGDGQAGVTLFIRDHNENQPVTVTTDTRGNWSYDGMLPAAITPNEPGFGFDPTLYPSINASSDEVDFVTSPFENTARLDNLLVGACYYPWFDTDRHWQEGYKGDPVLGEYDSQRLEINEIHISLAASHGIDFFVTSWWGENSFEDSAIRNGLLQAANVDQMKFAILYETPGRLGTDSAGRIDLDDPQKKQKLISDVQYLADTYFGLPQYLKIDGKPVLYLYLTRIFSGAYADAIQELRSAISDRGFELYLIGDQVYWQDPSAQEEIDLMQSFDGVSAYNMHTSVDGIDNNFVQKALEKYSEWVEVADSVNVDFIPGVIPGFDDTEVRPEAQHPVIEKDPERFRSFLEGMKPQLSSNNMAIITSWNEWHEFTQIEPGVESGTAYLEVLEQSLTGKTRR